jgi:two-component system alkaline phosphatase synthesis response regulator PhoP
MELVLVIDAEPHTRRLVRDNLERADYRVLTASDAETGLHMLHRESPDLLVLDLGLPQQEGWSLTRNIRLDHQLASLPILLLTPQSRNGNTIDGIELGADDYVVKPFNPRELVERVQVLLRRMRGQSSLPARLTRGELTLDTGGRRLMIGDVLVELTPTEFALMCMFMEKPGRVFTRRELLDKIIGSTVEDDNRTLDTHIRNLRHKIESDPHQPVYIQTVHRVGYQFAGSPNQR